MLSCPIISVQDWSVRDGGNAPPWTPPSIPIFILFLLAESFLVEVRLVVLTFAPAAVVLVPALSAVVLHLPLALVSYLTIIP